MHWSSLQSRLISEYASDLKSATLHVRLRNGQQAAHENIAPQMVENLRTAESPGFYYSYYIAPLPTRTEERPVRPGLSIEYVRLLAGRIIRRIAKSRSIEKLRLRIEKALPQGWLDLVERRVVAAERFLHIR